MLPDLIGKVIAVDFKDGNAFSWRLFSVFYGGRDNEVTWLCFSSTGAWCYRCNPDMTVTLEAA